MKVSAFLLAPLVGLASSSAILIPNSFNNSVIEHAHSPTPGHGPGYNCYNEINEHLCGFTPWMKKHCNIALNQWVIHSDDFFYDPQYGTKGKSTASHPKACYAGHNLMDVGCGIFVEGDPSCSRSGNDLVQDYHDIFKNGACHTCGVKYWDLADKRRCRTKVDYVTGCMNGAA